MSSSSLTVPFRDIHPVAIERAPSPLGAMRGRKDDGSANSYPMTAQGIFIERSATAALTFATYPSGSLQTGIR